MIRKPIDLAKPAAPQEGGRLAGEDLTGLVDGLTGHPKGLDLREAEEGAAAADAAEAAEMTEEEREAAEEAEARPNLGFTPRR
ncbi:hypothetical protein [Falsiroseomonas tokyonensis]|uniref:Chromosome partitioning protein ParB n=1 Tax=Falsiroseomonas tokyonensis TaxID=430521 RepID=A0ABV7C1D9_9PROT|nr:hypothetical protein [Falsiroseomonas tokyonensis]MBU8540131.1 hypothetical protein [Falsiroseomonas tokyonensis]